MNNASQLEKIFHEPNRLAIVSELSASAKGKTFSEIKTACDLTDGNLSRHLSALEKEGVIKIKKGFEGVKPCTRALLTERGRRDFLNYLDALEGILKQAARRARALEQAEAEIPAAHAKALKA